jgi:hypothetical protein
MDNSNSQNNTSPFTTTTVPAPWETPTQPSQAMPVATTPPPAENAPIPTWPLPTTPAPAAPAMSQQPAIAPTLPPTPQPAPPQLINPFSPPAQPAPL